MLLFSIDSGKRGGMVNTTMLKKILMLLITIGSLSASETKEYIARVTYYWPGNGGQVGNITSTGKPAVCGKSVAVDPRIIPYGSKIEIPDMKKTFIAKDTGSAVRNRTASKRLGRNNIVIDVFCANRAEARRRIREYPMFMRVIVTKK